MCHRGAIFLIPLVLMCLCGDSAGQEDVPAKERSPPFPKNVENPLSYRRRRVRT